MSDTLHTDSAARPARLGTWGTGRRKTSVARVRVTRGDGQMAINGRTLDQYFTEPQDREHVRSVFLVTESLGHWNVFVNVSGGGHTGQAGAIRMGLARALMRAQPEYELKLRHSGFLTRDARAVERKKYGRRKARRRFQFSKR